MTHPLSHLAPADRHQAEFDDAVRIAIIQRDRWIDYPRAAQARERLNRLLATPQRERMPCMVVYGESNIEPGPKGIRVHPMSPGPLKTRAASELKDFDLLLNEAAERAPLGKLVDIMDVGSTCAYLSTPYARRMRGETIYVGGGLHIMA